MRMGISIPASSTLAGMRSMPLLVFEDALPRFQPLALDDGAQVVGERHLKGIGVLPPERLGEVALRVGVHEEHPLAPPGQGDAQAQARGGLSRAALLVRDCDGSAWHGSCLPSTACAVTGGQFRYFKREYRFRKSSKDGICTG